MNSPNTNTDPNKNNPASPPIVKPEQAPVGDPKNPQSKDAGTSAASATDTDKKAN